MLSRYSMAQSLKALYSSGHRLHMRGEICTRRQGKTVKTLNRIAMMTVQVTVSEHVMMSFNVTSASR